MSPISPTSRSRTLLFLSYRDSTAPSSRTRRQSPFSYGDTAGNGFHVDDERERLIFDADERVGEGPGHVALHVDLPPKWVDISDQVHDVLATTQQKIATLERLHAKHVLPGFADRSAEEREIESLTSDITRDFRRCQSLVQSIPTVASSQGRHAFPPQGQSRHEKLAAQNVQRALAAKVQELSATFRKKQRVYLETLQGHAIKNQDLLVASGALTLKGSEATSDLDEDMRVASQTVPLSQSLQEQSQIIDDIDQTVLLRSREISEIATSISQLASLFKDLSSLVIDQGTLLDSIEYNIEQTAVEMQEAVRELGVAEGLQRRGSRRGCICLLLLGIMGLVLVLVFKPRKHGRGTPTTAPSSTESSMREGEGEALPPIPVDVTTLDPGSIAAEVGDAPSLRTLRKRLPVPILDDRFEYIEMPLPMPVQAPRTPVDSDERRRFRTQTRTQTQTRMRARLRRQKENYG